MFQLLPLLLTGLIETTLVAVPIMSKSESGRGGLIVNVASVLGLEPGPFAAVYSATKHGVVGFTRSLADPHYNNITGISYIAICPGATVTGLLDTFVGVDTFEMSKPISERIIKAKNQTAEECAEAMMQAIEKAENGSVWICDLGKCEKVEMHKYWSYILD
ncbi:alcohol dehydrogenase-like [Teleopsis dalmanni]|uniref:alcohol dehydrogenase-like n=1 Tax=Teleopsis dalmanni TaxID=139649 RepID=UPI0018CD46AA|nr:alcohol dehydrogenase-like [Teleopsis dalmanni]